MRLKPGELCPYVYAESAGPQADATITLTRTVFDAITMEKTTFEKEITSGNIKIQGNRDKLGELMGLLDTFKGGFNIVTP
ncbi:alkyl sulfatase C-terminal domain-containing protein [Candidatus Jettenia sp. AMX1]|uniref:alkyl sulfatase C-terminal domain-containing protein n=1 Tax=Candidatus Jettenia sp. AMX1 TaxID=2293637 RepID=UPI00332F5F2D